MNRLLRTEFTLMVREKITPLMAIALPIALLVGFGSLPGSDKPVASLGGQEGGQYIAALSVGVVVFILGTVQLPAVLAGYREMGILRRLGASPARPSWMLSSQLVIHLVMVAVAVALMIGLGAAFFATGLPSAWFAVALLFAVLTMFSLGLLVAAVARTGKGANGLGMLLMFPSFFLAGVYVPREQLPAVVRTIGDFTPLGAGLKALRDTWMGTAPRPIHLVIMALYAVIAGLAATKFFRWE